MRQSSIIKVLDKLFEEAYQYQIAKKNIAIITDAHLNKLGGRNDFEKNKDEFETALDFYELNKYRLILPGDIFDLLEAKSKEIYEAYHDLIDRMFALTDVYLPGNHDRKYWTIDIPDHIVVTESVKLMFEDTIKAFSAHGHQIDYANKGGWFTKIVELFVEHVWANLQDVFSPARRETKSISLDNKLATYCFESGRSAVFGHTHNAQVQRRENIFYMNCGSWVGDYGFSVEALNGEFQIVKWLPGGTRSILEIADLSTKTFRGQSR